VKEVEELVAAGDDINQTDNNGQTAAYNAVYDGELRAARHTLDPW
jgi:ankyrin repeat protein